MAIESVTLHRRAMDAGEPTNRDILDKLEAFIEEHRRDHGTLDSRLAVHDTGTALQDSRIAALQRLTDEIATLHDFRVQVETIGTSVKWILGGSLLAALAAIASLIATFSHIIQSGS